MLLLPQERPQQVVLALEWMREKEPRPVLHGLMVGRLQANGRRTVGPHAEGGAQVGALLVVAGRGRIALLRVAARPAARPPPVAGPAEPVDDAQAVLAQQLPARVAQQAPHPLDGALTLRVPLALTLALLVPEPEHVGQPLPQQVRETLPVTLMPPVKVAVAWMKVEEPHPTPTATPEGKT
ncbi:hypothetical protein FIBSPDRAFT_905153 [Athelia psychrophila]|uniref:Uncharacterized protein n=1 Tax=Athelia psychrophila TaxID=1759441 RepID=A0A167TTC3_9AGAM|nr:hypothetical protein FIBSPDRAFT_905153 [Fibularhizoctonia sp. CBS 109695]